MRESGDVTVPDYGSLDGVGATSQDGEKLGKVGGFVLDDEIQAPDVGLRTQRLVRGPDPACVRRGVVNRFVAAYQAGKLITPTESATALVPRPCSTATGQIWNVAGVASQP